MSSRDAYSEPERGRTVTAVLLSLAILAVIGAVFGFVLGSRDIDGNESGSGDGQSAGPTGVRTSQGTAEPPDEECPGFIKDGIRKRNTGAALPVYLVLYIRTAKREAWVCREADGEGLWYQGHDKKANFYEGGEIPKEGDNGLLLNTVTNTGPDKYLARNGNTNYYVSRSELRLTGDQNFTEPVVKSLP